ncbi:hypothetical protein [Carboxylicivirga linearis]|uniref:Outer membrane protein beta-barrel domain-containing protein n=1 Tax=Carboxylicivirga linearis TaxID=1628157 RepID=A0ABS5JWA8_9BACT|nr:hypothetical protein [Carboxylicivirga linearis]MBS2099172.1 hypothetical protein [Carboxylicivirga linearis]
MKYYLCVFVLFISALEVSSQNFKMSMEVGVGLYKLDGLKSLNEMVLEDLPYNGRQVKKFPAAFYYRPGLSYQFSKVSFGINYSYLRAESRISTKEEGIEYSLDMRPDTHMPALHVDALLLKMSKMEAYLRLSSGFSFSHLKIDEYYSVNESVIIEDDLILKSTNYFVEPSLYFTYPLKSLLLESHVGYSLSMGDNVLTDSSGGIELTNPINGNPITPDWSGLRIGIGIAYTFAKSK